jgi:hypothetical protein
MRLYRFVVPGIKREVASLARGFAIWENSLTAIQVDGGLQ